MASIYLTHQSFFWESRTGYYPENCETVRERANELADAAGRAVQGAVQADYERAIHELSMDSEIETGLL